MRNEKNTPFVFSDMGEFEFTIGNEKKIVREGDTLYKVPSILKKLNSVVLQRA